MTDRELLEAAAKAAGISLRFLSTGAGPVPFSDGPQRIGEWNPLTDDGDALRLAVALGMVVDASRPSVNYPFQLRAFVERGDDRVAATRRAIVRAAASMGDAK